MYTLSYYRYPTTDVFGPQMTTSHFDLCGGALLSPSPLVTAFSTSMGFPSLRDLSSFGEMQLSKFWVLS